jgi:hypothetical protein
MRACHRTKVRATSHVAIAIPPSNVEGLEGLTRLLGIGKWQRPTTCKVRSIDWRSRG